jgi:hypothetical protein
VLYLAVILVLAGFLEKGNCEQNAHAPLTIACDANFMPYTMLNSDGQPACGPHALSGRHFYVYCFFVPVFSC